MESSQSANSQRDPTNESNEDEFVYQQQKYSKYVDFTSSDELGDDQVESYASESNLSFNEIEQEYETKHFLSTEDNFDQPSVELGVNPEELISDRKLQQAKIPISKENELTPVHVSQ